MLPAAQPWEPQVPSLPFLANIGPQRPQHAAHTSLPAHLLLLPPTQRPPCRSRPSGTASSSPGRTQPQHSGREWVQSGAAVTGSVVTGLVMILLHLAPARVAIEMRQRQVQPGMQHSHLLDAWQAPTSLHLVPEVARSDAISHFSLTFNKHTLLLQDC
jgi:hypothetical protein